MNRTAIVTFVFLVFQLALFNAPLIAQKPTIVSKVGAKHSDTGKITRLSAGTIFITIADSAPHFVVDNIDKSMDAKNLSLFLNAFYKSSKVKRTNDILIRSKTKRLVPGESEVQKLMKELNRKHGINVVYFPPPTGINPDAEIQEFARRHLK